MNNLENQRQIKTNKPKLHPSQTIISFDKKACNRYSIINQFFMIFGIIYLPIRAALIIIPLLITWALLKIASIGVKYPDNTWNMQETSILGKFRRKLIWVIAYSGFRVMLLGFGIFWISIDGKEHLTERTKIVVYGPHQTMMDVVIHFAVAPMFSGRTPTGLAAFSEKSRPIISIFCLLLEYVFVDYESQESKRTAAKSSMLRATSEHWDHVIQIFAVEGTTSSGREFLQVKKGAFLSKQPVTPVLLEWPEWIDVLTNNLGKSRNSTRAAGWSGWANDVGFGTLIWYQLTVPWQPVHITILPLHEPTESEKADPVVFAKRIQQVLSEKGGHAISECNQIDSKLVEYISSKYPEVDVRAFRVCGESLEDEFGSKGVNKKMILEFYEDFARKSCGKLVFDGLSFQQFVRKKLREKSE